MINDLVISQIRQRLEILYQMVDELETGGGGGGTSDYSQLSNKPQINSTTLEGNKTAAQLGLATSTAVSSLTERFNNLFALDGISLETNDEYPSTLNPLLALHQPLNINNINYYFFEESGIDYTYFAIDTSGAHPKISYAQFLKDSHKVIFYDFETDTVPTTSSDNFITSGGVYTALQDKANVTTVAGLIDAGAKNKLNHTAYTRTVNGVNYTVNADKSITITSDGTNTQSLLYLVQNEPLAAGSYILSGCTGGSSTKYDLRVKVGNTVTNNYDGGTPFTADGNPIESSIVVRAGQTLNVTIKPMISTAADYAISSEYVPYAPSNRGLYEEIEDTNATVLPFLSGRKVYEHYFGSTSGSDTYTATATDFGSGDLRKCGIYLIYRISWSTAPVISIYALAYSGGNTNYTTLQKIAGEDFDITVAQSVLSFTTAGKIQIIAIT